MAYPLNPKQLCLLLIEAILALTTNFELAASNCMENKNRKDPGH
jgi:hypothetical protein